MATFLFVKEGTQLRSLEETGPASKALHDEAKVHRLGIDRRRRLAVPGCGRSGEYRPSVPAATGRRFCGWRSKASRGGNARHWGGSILVQGGTARTHNGRPGSGGKGRRQALNTTHGPGAMTGNLQPQKVEQVRRASPMFCERQGAGAHCSLHRPSPTYRKTGSTGIPVPVRFSYFGPRLEWVQSVQLLSRLHSVATGSPGFLWLVFARLTPGSA